MSLLVVDRLSITVPGVSLPLVDALSFALDAGGSLAIVGESGSGKSLAMQALLGLQAPELRVQGSARFNGRELVGVGEATLNAVRGAQIGFVFQDASLSLNPFLPVGLQIAESLQVHRGASRAAAWQEAQRLLDAVRVARPGQRLAQYPHELSGGMRQRVMFAAALACRPQLLIADEPTTALDATVQRQLVDLLRDLRRDFALSLLLITHDLGLVGELCEQTLVLYAGRQMEVGASASLLRAPQHPYTQALLRARPSLTDDVDTPLPAIPGALQRAQLDGRRCRFIGRCTQAMAECDGAEPAWRVAERSALRCHRHTSSGKTTSGE
ncbi:ABC transporter ATP-binding protein [Solimonas marina]|uniref:ABC transporter ATP-binding protein n=1 Tax=Solimonas marina TaxID=2714601 RepID=A0A969WBK6_9GAMM|nr:ABC transporter ATP-binding protein [Solimonas marina]NKF23952.1 ABC transporter ATP-binding protein [Solimonas marina]